MQPPQVKPDDPKFTCDVLLYDEESDRHVRITWMEALNASGVGKIVADNVAKAFTGDMELSPGGAGKTLGDWFKVAVEWATYSADMDLWVQADGTVTTSQGAVGSSSAAFALASTGMTPGKVTKMAAYDVGKANVRLVIARPFIEHLMHSVILTVSGRETGATCAILLQTPIRGCC